VSALLQRVQKLCPTCATVKPVEEFYRAKERYDGVTAQCGECLRERYWKIKARTKPVGQKSYNRGRRNCLPVSAKRADPYEGDVLGRNPAAWDPPGDVKEFDELMGLVRRLNCRHYDHCLDVADRLSWLSFTCLRCPVSDDYTPNEILAMSDGLLEMVRELKA
jgi:hypothetical protein